jgi:hypothetical protein
VAHVVNQRVDEKKIKTSKQEVSSPMLDGSAEVANQRVEQKK